MWRSSHRGGENIYRVPTLSQFARVVIANVTGSPLIGAKSCRYMGHSHSRPHHSEGDPLQRQPDITLVNSTYGWSPTVSLREGLGLMIDHFRAHETF